MQSRNNNEAWHTAGAFDGGAKPADYIFLLRPMILIPVWTFFLLGAHHAKTAAASAAIDARSLSAGLVSITAAFGAVYIINQITDRQTDLRNRKLFLLPHSIISVRAASAEAALLVAAALAIGFLAISAAYAGVVALILVLGAAYSLEPVRLKRRAVLDVCANAAGNGILNTMAGWIALGAPLSGVHVLLPYPLAVASVHLTTTLADIEGDRESGLRTSGVALGRGKGRVVSAILMALACAAAAAVANRAAFWAALLSLPLFLIPSKRGEAGERQSGVLLPAKAATLVFSLTAGFFFPPYIIFLAAAMFLTRIYYRRRFGIRYPAP
jgi:1,4-dihydroxy-2-naphthoate octaprenyltransferase